MTNPDNVGGLPTADQLYDIAADAWDQHQTNCRVTTTAGSLRKAVEAIYSELCRAAPAGVVEMRICEVPHLILKRDTLYRFTVDANCERCRQAAAFGSAATAGGDDAPHWGNLPDDFDDSAPPPAGSGEVRDAIESLAWAEEYFEQRADAEFSPDVAPPHGNEEMVLLVKIQQTAALLRKLQQGADYEPAFWNVRKDGKHLILFPLNGAVTITTYLEMVAGAHPGAAIDAETLYRAASHRKEAFNG